MFRTPVAGNTTYGVVLPRAVAAPPGGHRPSPCSEQEPHGRDSTAADPAGSRSAATRPQAAQARAQPEPDPARSQPTEHLRTYSRLAGRVSGAACDHAIGP